jgi:predicted amino acid-binding ACT domain protein
MVVISVEIVTGNVLNVSQDVISEFLATVTVCDVTPCNLIEVY